MKKEYKNCQSCSLPLKKDPKGGALNFDGTKNNMYCSFCYEDGEFIHPDWNVEQMQDFVKGKMKSMGFPGFLAGLFTKGIPNLQRWKAQ